MQTLPRAIFGGKFRNMGFEAKCVLFLLFCTLPIYIRAQSKAKSACEEYVKDPNALCTSQPFQLGVIKAAPKEFPHMALVGSGSKDKIRWVCAGNLISDQFVLTAAHCLYDSDFGEIKHVRLGELNTEKDLPESESPQNYNVIAVNCPPNYKPPSFYNDIGLLTLDRKVEFNAFIRPACLHLEQNLPGDTALVSGWGPIAYLEPDSDDLLKESVSVVTQDHCNSSYKHNVDNDSLEKGIIPESQVCAVVHGCLGKGGGPLQIYNSDEDHCTYLIVGLTSFGKACGTANSPTVFTRVSAYIPWIESIVWNSE